ncbi:FabD/lysophospholipase-like protein [Thozetella sp. PMI_491]|nr:FabD/lysophospholipase-like protein [Thozetella sp. PMI_491]
MDRLNQARKVAGLPSTKPCEVFDLIGGTSTGGLIAIMLGRLEMDVDECILEYCELIGSIFNKKKHSKPISLSGMIQPKFDSERLKGAINEVITKRGMSPTDPFNDGVDRGCKVFVCAATKDLYGIAHLRSYSIEDELDIPTTVCEAALATSAATGFFDPVSIGARQFVDGAIGANNPVDEVEREASNIWCNETGDLKPLVKCFISIGTGNPGKKAIEDSILKFLTKSLRQIATETEETAQKFIARWRRHYDQNRYFRFNVEQGLQDVGLAEYTEQGSIETATHSYIADQAQKFRVRDCVRNLERKQSVYTVDFS